MAVALLPLAVAAGKLIVDVGGDYYPHADHAALEARTRDLGHHAVLTGLYSRDDWSHPGPAHFYVMALPYWLSGRSSIAFPLGALLINAGSIAGMALVARRLAGTPLLVLTLLACGVVVQALGADFMADPWNPFITVFPFGLLLFLCWAMLCGERWALPVGAGVATFCAQTHIGYVALGLPLLALGAIGLVVASSRRARAPTDPPLARALAVPTTVAGGILVVLWAPPLVEQFTHEPGNIGQVIRYFRGAGGETHSLAEGLRVVMGQFGLPPEWVSGARPENVFSGEHEFLFEAPWPVLLVPVAVAVAVLWRRRVGVALRLALVVGAAMVLGVLSVARTVGLVYAYRLRWTWLLAAAAAVLVAWAAWILVGHGRLRPGRRWLVAASLIALVSLTGINVIGAARVDPPHHKASVVVGTLVPSTVEDLPEGSDPVLVRATSLAGAEYAAGLTLALERRGIAAQVENFDDRGWGEHRVFHGGPVRSTVTVAVDDGIDNAADEPGLRRIAYWGMSEDERVRRVRRIGELDAAYEAGDLPLHAWTQQRREALPPYSAVAVFGSPPPPSIG
jgi:hypothetical protein